MKTITSSRSLVATALTVYGIETEPGSDDWKSEFSTVATALTVYGIETGVCINNLKHLGQLQQHLPFTVLKRWINYERSSRLY